MKFLIWFLCIMANVIITMIINDAGIILGGIPSALMFAVTFWLARTLCQKWEAHKEYGELEKEILNTDPQSVVQKDERLEQQRTYTAQVSNSQWQCSCGRVRAKYESSCICGKSKFDVMNSPKTEAVSSETTAQPATDSKNLFCRKCGEKLLPNSQFCSRCGTKV